MATDLQCAIISLGYPHPIGELISLVLCWLSMSTFHSPFLFILFLADFFTLEYSPDIRNGARRVSISKYAAALPTSKNQLAEHASLPNTSPSRSSTEYRDYKLYSITQADRKAIEAEHEPWKMQCHHSTKIKHSWKPGASSGIPCYSQTIPRSPL